MVRALGWLVDAIQRIKQERHCYCLRCRFVRWLQRAAQLTTLTKPCYNCGHTMYGQETGMPGLTHIWICANCGCQDYSLSSVKEFKRQTDDPFDKFWLTRANETHCLWVL